MPYCTGGTFEYLDWADLGEDRPRVLADFRPLGPRRAPGALGRVLARKITQVAPKISPGDQL